MRRFALLLPLVLVSTSQACLNDRDSDTLANQANAFPETLRVITGRFERNPPLFYKMRIRREEGLLKQNPRQLNLYDDIAVAYTRIHKDDLGLLALERKRAEMRPFDMNDPELKEDWYRYFANAGTLHVHHWLANGAKIEDMAEMTTARKYIQRAIEIKPNAHFGRERYQLMTMEWIVARRSKKPKTTLTLGQWIEAKDHWSAPDRFGDVIFDDSKQKAATAGLSGLIVLGAA